MKWGPKNSYVFFRIPPILCGQKWHLVGEITAFSLVHFAYFYALFLGGGQVKSHQGVKLSRRTCSERERARTNAGFHQQEFLLVKWGPKNSYVFFRIPPILWVNSGIPVGEIRAGTNTVFTNRNATVGGILRSCVKIRKMQ